MTTNGAQVTLYAPSASKTYDGKPLTAVGSGNAVIAGAERTEEEMSSDQIVVTGLPVGFTVEATASGAQTDAGSNANVVNNGYVIKNAAGEDRTSCFTNITTVDGTLTVTPKAAIITTGSGIKSYDGTALTNENATITGLLDGESVTLYATGTITEIGSTDNTYSIEWDNAKADNYTLTESLGKLTINGNAAEIILTAPSAEKVYDGTALTAGADQLTVTGLPAGFTVDATVTGSQTDAGSSANTVTADFVIRNSGGDDKTANFTNVKTANGTLTVTKKPVTITTGSGSKAYDGTALTSAEAKIDSLAADESVTLTATGTITEIGEAENTYDIVWDNANEKNYTVTATLGTLVIKPNNAEVVLTAASASQTYNGSALTANTVTAAGLPEGFRVEATASGSQTDAGSSANTVEAKYVIYNATGDDKTDYFTNIKTVDGTLTVTKKAVTIITGSATRLYSGQALTESTATITGLIENESVTLSATGTITEVGSTPNTYQIDWTGAKAENYEISEELGTLTIENNDEQVLLIAPSATKTYDGTALTASGEQAAADDGITYGDSGAQVTAQGLPEGFTVEATATGSQTEADSSKNVVNDGYVIRDADGADRTANFTNVEKADGTLTVTPKAVTITTGSGSKAYDGTPLTNAEVSIDGLVEGESVTLAATGTITVPDTVSNAYEITWDNAKAKNYVITEQIGTLTVKPNDTAIVLTAPSASKTYDGQALDAAAVEGGVTVTGLPDGFTYTATATGQITDAGTAKSKVADGFAILNAENENCTSFFTGIRPEDGTLTVYPRAVTITTGSGEKEYDGSPLRNTEVSIEGLVDDESVTLSASGTQTEVGNSTNTYVITWDQATAANYSVTENLGTLTVTENTSVVTLTAASDHKDYDGKALTNNTVTASGLPTGFSIKATASGSQTDAGTSDNVVDDGYVICDSFGAEKTANFTNVSTQKGTLTVRAIPVTVTTGSNTGLYDGMPVTKNEASIEGLIQGETVGITATGSQIEVGSSDNTYVIEWNSVNPNNYTITENLGTLTVMENNGQILLTAPSTTKMYDGTALTADGTGYLKVTAEGLPAGFTVEATASGSQTNAGSSANVVNDGYVIKNAAGEDRTASYTNVVKVDGTLKVEEVPVTITTGSDQKAYDGTALTKSEAAITGLVNGENAVVTATGLQTEVGRSTNLYTIDWGTTNAGNYTVTEDLGTLEVTANSGTVTLTAPSASKTYDGNALTAGGNGVTASGLPNGFTVAATTSGSQTDAGRSANVVDGGFVIRNAAGEDRTANFTAINRVDGTLTVNPAPVTITTGSDSKAYDGTPLTNSSVQIGGLVSGEQVTLATTGTITEIGEVENTYSITWDTAKADNYTVTDNLGKLTITENDAEVVLTAPSASKTYDGVPLTADGKGTIVDTVKYQNESNRIKATGLPAGFTVEATVSGTLTDVGNTDNIIESYVIYDADHNNRTASFTKVATVSGSLKVNPAPITIRTESDSKAYDGTALTNATAEIAGLVNGETASVTATGAQTEVGSSTNGYAITWGTATAGNYTITDTLGTLTVTENGAVVTLTAASDEKTYDGTPLANKAVTAAGLPAGFTVEAAASGTQTDAGESANVVNDNYIICNAAGIDKTANFTNVEKVNGSLTVNKKEVTVKTGSKQKIYDGKALTCADAEITGLVGTESVTLRTTGTITEVGFVPNPCEITWDGANADNYTLTTAYGTLLVATQDTDVILVAPDATKVYDGTALTADGSGEIETGVTYGLGSKTDVTGATSEDNRIVAIGLPEGFSVEASASGSLTDAGSIANTVNDGYVIKNADDQNRTQNFTKVVKVDGTLTVEKKDVTVTAGSRVFEYNGLAQSWDGITVNGLVGDDAITATTVGSITFPYETGVKNLIHTFAFAAGKAANYNVILEPGDLSMHAAARPIMITAESDEWTYDGAAHQNTGVTLTSGTLFAGDELVASANGSVQNVADTGDNNNPVASYRIMHGDTDVTDSYVVSTVAGTLTVNPRNVTLTSATAQKEYDGTPLTTADLENGGVTVSGDGFASGEGASFDVTGTRTLVGSSENAFTFALNEGMDANNYRITTIPGTLTITNRTDKPVVKVQAESASYQYDGTEKSATKLSGLTFATGGQKYTIEGLAAGVSGTNAGTYENKINGTAIVRDANGNNVTDQFTVETEDGALQITPRQITMTSASDSRTYNGNALTNATVTVTGDGFADGEGATYDVTGSQTVVGSCDNAFAYNLNEGTLAENYSITTVFGSLLVTGRQAKYTIVLEANSGEFLYDGIEHSISGLKTTKFAVEGNIYTVSGMQAEASATKAGEYPVNIVGTPVVKDADGNDVTDQFAVTTKSGTLSIAKRQLTMTSESAEKMYDGTTLTAGEIAVTGDGFADGEGAVYSVTGSRTIAGTAENTFTYVLNNGTLEENYNIETVYGKLTILNRAEDARYEITIRAASGEALYDGTVHSVSGLTGVATANAVSMTGDEAVTANGEAVAVTVDGNTYYVSGLTAEAEGTNAGTYTVPVKGTPVVLDAAGNDVTSEFIVHTADGTLEIAKRNVTLTSATESRRYNGRTLRNDQITVSGDGFVAGEGVSCDVTGAQTVAGSSENSFTYTCNDGTDENNYVITPIYGTLTVTSRETKYEVIVTANSAQAMYDGTKHAVSGLMAVATDEEGAGLTAENNAANEGELAVTVDGNVYYISGLEAEAEGTNAGEYRADVVGTPFIRDAENNDVTSEFAVTTRGGVLTITPRQITLTSASDRKVYDGTALTAHKVTVTGDGFVAGEGATYAFRGSRILVGSSKNEFSYALTGGAAAENYEITTVYGTLTVTDREEKYAVTLQANSGEATYDGASHAISGLMFVPGDDTTNTLFSSSVVTPSGKDITIAAGGNTYYVSGLSASATGVDADQYTVAITGTPVVRDTEGNDVTDQFDLTLNPGVLIINPRSITLTSDSGEKEYDGTPLVARITNHTGITVSEEGFADGEGATYDVTGSQTQVGESKNTFTYKLNDGTNADNYVITTEEGLLTVKDRTQKYEFGVTAAGGTFMYDGTEKSVSGLIADGTTDVTANGRAISFTAEGNTYRLTGLSAEQKATNAGTYTVSVTGTPVVRDASGNDVTAQFVIHTADSQLVISKRNVTLTSASATHTYTGRALTNPEVTVGGDGFATGEGAAYDVTGSQTLVGISENVFTYALNDNTNADNYNITSKFGTLSVTNRDARYEITLTPQSAEYKYDGTEKSVDGFMQTAVTVDDMTYYVSGLTAGTSATNAGTWPVTVTGTPVVTDADGNDVTEQFAVSIESAEMVIRPRTVLLTSESLSREFNGTALHSEDAAAILISGDGFAEGEGAEITYTGSRTLVGTSDNTFTYVCNEGTLEDNYRIDTAYGLLTITNRNARYEITLQANSDEVTYDGTEQSVSGFAETTFEVEGNLYTVEGINAYAAGTEAGTYLTEITGNAIVRNEDGDDVTDQFAVYVQKGTLTIKAKQLIIRYEDEDGDPIDDPYIETYDNDDNPGPIPSPEVEDLVPDYDVVTAPNGITGDTEVVVTYRPQTEEQSTEAIELTDNSPRIASITPTDDGYELEEIGEADVPLTTASSGYWALINLLMMIGSVIVMILVLITWFFRNDDDDDDDDRKTDVNAAAAGRDEGNEEKRYRRIQKKPLMRIIAIIVTIIAVIAFILTEDMTKTMELADQYTLLMVILFIVDLILAVFSRRKKKEDEEDENENQTA